MLPWKSPPSWIDPGGIEPPEPGKTVRYRLALRRAGETSDHELTTTQDLTREQAMGILHTSSVLVGGWIWDVIVVQGPL